MYRAGAANFHISAAEAPRKAASVMARSLPLFFTGSFYSYAAETFAAQFHTRRVRSGRRFDGAAVSAGRDRNSDRDRFYYSSLGGWFCDEIASDDNGRR